MVSDGHDDPNLKTTCRLVECPTIKGIYFYGKVFMDMVGVLDLCKNMFVLFKIVI